MMTEEELRNFAADREDDRPQDDRQRVLQALERANIVPLSIVPQTPSQYMCAVGAQVGGVDLFTARRVYRAMLAAALERPTMN
jgi:hypothetical protein